MKQHRPGTSPAGFTLVELLLGVVVFLIAAVVLGNHITSNYTATAMQRDKVFAFTKAQAMLSEIHALVDRGDIDAAIDLDVLDDGVTTKPALTIARDQAGVLVSPDHELSGNIERQGDWVWSRRISVRPFAGLNNRNVRYVTVRILKRDNVGREHEMASLSSVVNSIGSAFPSTQVFDVYLLAVENIPGWWVFMEAIVPFVESAITDLENRNPGLSVRTHWISKSAYGRNPVYRPFFNNAVDSEMTVPNVYFYPSKMPAGNSSTFYYVPDLVKARVNVDGLERNGWDPVTNPYPYALADWYNHAMRYPLARQLHDARRAEVLARKDAIRQAELLGVAPPPRLVDMSAEPPLQILLEEMASNPDQYRHALLINLHGELLPVPPLRNYSDFAKLPDLLPGVRVVTHPEELRTQSPPTSGTETTDVRLRVYAHTLDASTIPPDGCLPSNHPILVQVMDVDLTDGTYSGVPAPGVDVLRVPGGVMVAGDNEYRPPEPATNYAISTYSWPEMLYACFFIDPGYGQRKSTLFVLYNTPLDCAPVSGKGLWINQRSRPYGMSYVPGAVGAGRSFAHDLSVAGDGPKNSARWIIEIPGTVWDEQRFVSPERVYFDPRTTAEPDVTLTVRTRIYDPNVTDPWWEIGRWPAGADGRVIEPENLSETYTWWARTRDAVPITERSQFFGDPRHNPYKDTLSGDPDFGDSYNWFFDSLTNNSQNALADHPGLVRSFNLWNGGPRFDVPRLMELYRTAITNSQAIYTTLSGYSYYYVGCGNEIGYDSSNGYPNSIPTNLKPWGGADTDVGFVDNITGTRALVREGSPGTDFWWGPTWLGEMYPDWAYASQWMALDVNGAISGNLASGRNNNRFFRSPESTIYTATDFKAYGTAMLNSMHRTSTRGCVSFFNNGTSAAHFNHHFSSGAGNLVGPGVELATNYGFPIPSSVEITRPFSVDTGGNVPPEFGYAPYNAARFYAEVQRMFYDHPSGYVGSGLVRFELPDRSSAAWIAVNGIAQTTTTGSSFLAKYCLLSMFQSYFELGDTTLSFRIKQPPRVEITSPTEITEIVDPASIDVQIETEWLRWDRLPYTTNTPAGFAENETEIDYAIYYSPDNGVNWRHVQDDSPAVIGERPSNAAYIVADSGIGAEVYTWPTPSGSFPEGSYLIRVEAYRTGMALHYSVHQVRIYISR